MLQLGEAKKIMTTINNIEDLIRLLDENPQWTEALRARLLTRELLELPEKFATYAEESNRRFERLEQQLATFAEETSQRFTQIAQQFEQVQLQFERVQQQFQRVENQIAQMNQRLGRVETHASRAEIDLGYLRGGHARSTAYHIADIIALELGLRRVRNLSGQDLWQMTETADVSQLSSGELRSFRHADLVMETIDSEGNPCYLAAEISFTVNGRDTTRAIRNAGLLTDFTGVKTQAVVIGVHRDDHVYDIIESGQVRWYPLSDDDLGVD
jgi:exonuclease VII small subunit